VVNACAFKTTCTFAVSTVIVASAAIDCAAPAAEAFVTAAAAATQSAIDTIAADSTTISVIAAICALGTNNEDAIAAAVAAACYVDTTTAVTIHAFSATKTDASDVAVSAFDLDIEKTRSDVRKTTVAAIAAVTDAVTAVGNPTTVATDAGCTINAITAAITMYLTTETATGIDDYFCCSCRPECAVRSYCHEAIRAASACSSDFVIIVDTGQIPTIGIANLVICSVNVVVSHANALPAIRSRRLGYSQFLKFSAIRSWHTCDNVRHACRIIEE